MIPGTEETAIDTQQDELTSATETIIAAALEEIRAFYSSQRYHNREHSTFVETEAMALADALPPEYALNDKERAILRLVASAHDVYYADNPRDPNYDGENEKKAAEWLANKMRRYTDVFTTDDIDTAVYAIHATRAHHHPAHTGTGWSNETTIQQNVGEGGSPPTHIIAQLLCDADLAGLGSAWEIQQSTMIGYYLELNPTGGSLETWREYLELQRLILKNRQYYTTAAQDRYVQNLLKNFAKVQAILRSPEKLAHTHQEVLERARH